MNIEDIRPECFDGNCEAPKCDTGITNCVHCGGELIAVNGFWYHHSQFYNDGSLISPNMPQDIVKI